MTRWFLIPSFLAAVAVAATVSPSAFAQNIEAANKERSAIMKANNRDLKALNKAAESGKVGAREAARAAAMRARTAKLGSLFPAGSGSDKIRTRAKPDIWMAPAKFEGDLKSFEKALASAESAAKSGDAKALAVAVKAADGACRACHKQFRGPRPN